MSIPSAVLGPRPSLIEQWQHLHSQAATIAERVANDPTGESLPAALSDVQTLKLTAAATVLVQQTFEDLAGELLHRPRR